MDDARDPETELAALARAIRASTLRRVEEVPPEAAGWRPEPGALSFADLVHHLVAADRWLFRKLRDPETPSMVARAGEAGAVDATGFEGLVDELRTVGAERERRLDALSPERLAERIPDDRFGGEVTTRWVVVRGTLEHEAQHRGQLALMLRLWRAR